MLKKLLRLVIKSRQQYLHSVRCRCISLHMLSFLYLCSFFTYNVYQSVYCIIIDTKIVARDMDAIGNHLQIHMCYHIHNVFVYIFCNNICTKIRKRVPILIKLKCLLKSNMLKSKKKLHCARITDDERMLFQLPPNL